jgi:excisionase family DNA binding protein
VVERDPAELLTVAEIAVELKITEQTVRRWINEQKLPAKRLAGGKEFRVLRAELDALLGLEPQPPAEQPRERAKRPFTATAAQITIQ